MNQPIALITGASSGIGKAAAYALARSGMRVFAGVRRREALDELLGPQIEPVLLDVTSDESVSSAIAGIMRQVGRIDVLVNNAGYGQYGLLEDVTMADAKRQFDANVFGLMRVTRAVLPIMRAQKAGRIINISSVAGRVSMPMAGWYSASKHAVEALSDALRGEAAPFGIQVTVIQPGAIKTGFDGVAVRELEQTTRTSVYQPMVAAFSRLVRSSYERAPGPEVVARAITRAATARKAPIRVALPLDSQAMMLIKGLFGDRVFDRIVGSQLRPAGTEPQNRGTAEPV